MGGIAVWGLPGSWLTSCSPFSQSRCCPGALSTQAFLSLLTCLAPGDSELADRTRLLVPFQNSCLHSSPILPSLLANILTILLEGWITVELMIAERLACALA